MKNRFDEFMAQLKETNFALKDYVDFPKITSNVQAISMRLNQLNYLLGQQDMSSSVRYLWKENPKAFSVLGILIALRDKDNKKAIDAGGNIHLVTDYFKSAEQVITFLNETGLTKVFQTKQVKNLVDYVFGVEVGLDTNARKNRGGHIMEEIVADIFKRNGVQFEQEVYYTRFPEIVKVLGVDNKRFDFVVRTRDKVYLIEANFYSGGGSKLNEVARSYTELAPKINSVAGFEFVWITDGIGWRSASNKLEEALAHIPNVYNLTSVNAFIDKLKQQV